MKTEKRFHRAHSKNIYRKFSISFRTRSLASFLQFQAYRSGGLVPSTKKSRKPFNGNSLFSLFTVPFDVTKKNAGPKALNNKKDRQIYFQEFT